MKELINHEELEKRVLFYKDKKENNEVKPKKQ